MQESSFQEMQCCHEIYILLKQKSPEELVGQINFVFDDLDLLITRKTVSGSLVMLKIAELSKDADYVLSLAITLSHKEPLLNLLLELRNFGQGQTLDEYLYKNHVWKELTDFFALNYQKFV